jgi:hypothetical protein
VWGDKTIIPDALVNPKLKFNDLLNAVIKASGSTHQPYEFKHNAYRRIPAVGAPGDHHQAGRGENESYLENFLNSIMKEDASQEGTNTLFSSNIDVRTHALEQLKDILKPGLPTGTDGLTASQSLKGIIDSETFHNDYLEKLGSDGDTLTALKLYIADLADGKIQEPSLPPEAEEVAKEIIAGGELDSIKPDEQGDETPVGGEPAPEAPPAEPAPAPAPEAPPAEPAPAATAPMAPPEGVAPPMAEDFSQGSETNYSPFTRTQNEEMGGNPRKEILKSIAGFWNKEEKNFTIGGTRVKTIILKNFKNGEYPHASVEDVKEIFAKIDKLDPSSPHEHELGRIKHLAGLGGHSEEPAEDVLYKQPAAHPGPTNIKP